MPDDTTGLTRRWVLRTAGVTATVGATNLATDAGATSNPYDDPEYPSEEWFAREQSNWVRTREEQLRELDDPGFQHRWQQSLINYVQFRRQQTEEPWWNRDGTSVGASPTMYRRPVPVSGERDPGCGPG